MKYGIWSRRSGSSVFGAAASWAKRDGQRLEFDTKTQADAEAKLLKEQVTSPNVSFEGMEIKS